MALTSDELADVELALGRPLSDLEARQAERWRDAALRLIGLQVDPSTLDQASLAYVVSEAVAARLRIEGRLGEKRVDVQIDDGRISREFHATGTGVEILPEWWHLLGVVASGGVGSTQMFGEPDLGGVDDWR